MRQASAHTRGARRSDTRRGSSGVPARKRRCSEAEPERTRLGTTQTAEQVEDSGAAFSRFVWGLQRTMWQVTGLNRLAGCHRWRAPGAGVASVVWQGEGASRWGGLQKSGSVWASPLSSVQISNRRAEEVHKAVRNWVADGDRAVSFLTLTLRHNARHYLRLLEGCHQHRRMAGHQVRARGQRAVRDHPLDQGCGGDAREERLACALACAVADRARTRPRPAGSAARSNLQALGGSGGA